MSQSQTLAMRLNSEGPNPFPAKLVFYGWDRRDGVTVIYSLNYIRQVEDGNGLKFLPPPPRVNMPFGVGLVEIAVSFSGAVATINYIYKTVRNTAEASYEMRAFTAETPIYKHKEFPMMFLWYGVGIRRGKVEWAHLEPGEPKVKKIKGENGVEKRVFETCPDPDPNAKNMNAMAGIQDFLEGRVEVSETKEYEYRELIPADVIKKVGAIERPAFFNQAPTNADAVYNWIVLNLSSFKRKHWIRSGAKIASSGSGYQVTRMWLLNTMTEWVPEIYTDRRLTRREEDEEEQADL